MGCNILQKDDELYTGGCDYRSSDDIMFLPIIVPLKGTKIPQHVHAFDHTTMITKGSVRVWVEDKLLGDFKEDAFIEIKAHKAHKFETLEDNTKICCVHNISKTGKVEIEAEHQLEIV